ncbi:MAG: hypothetical protein DHS20C20_32820 [Ardenticatenaceae bacterium]|nr:MAG: hypothetical protein DHS20C20_32820 [Ardenticatenaceae bacterium]
MKTFWDINILGLFGRFLIACIIFTVACSDDAAPNESVSDSNQEVVEQEALPTNEPVAEQTVAVADSGNINLPATNALLICDDEMGQQLWQFDAADQTWHKQEAQFLSEPRFIAQGLVPVGDDLFIYGILQDETAAPRFQLYSWPEMVDQPLLDTESVFQVLRTTDRLPALNALYAVQAETPGTSYQLSLEQCQTGTCEFNAVDQMEFVSPDRTQSVLWDTATWELRLENDGEDNRTLLGTGWDPFWLGENKIGFLSVAASNIDLSATQPELVLWQEGAEAELLLTTAQAKEHLIEQGAVDEATEIILFKAGGTPAHSNVVLVTAVDPAQPGTTFLLELNIETGSLRYIPELTGMSLAELELTADGEFLVVQDNNGVQLYALGTGEIVEFAQVPDGHGYAYLADGGWLLLPAGSTTYFAQPSEGVVEEVNLAGQYCTLGAWLVPTP